MKKNIILIFSLLFSISAFSQINFGVKAGTAFGYNGSLKQTFTGIKESNGKNNIGWHLGLFGNFGLSNWFIQPEIYYSSMKTDFKSSEGNFSARSNHLDIPILAGKKFLNLVRVYAGPVFSTSLDEKISLKNVKKTKTEDLTIAGQIGTGIDVSSFTIDLRYEFGFNKNETKFVNNYTNSEFQIDKRQNSMVVSVGYKF